MSEPLATHTSSPAELQERIAAERLGVPFLVFRDGDGAQRIIGLDGSAASLTVGRRPDNDVPLPWDARVSRLHAVVELVGGEWTISDDGLSQNGTWVGQDRISGRHRLADGDLVRIGATQILFRDPRVASALGTTVFGDPSAAPAVELTAAQRRILVALCRPYRTDFGHPATNQDIARELAYSVDAVKTHLRTLFRKFAIGDMAQNQKRLQLAERALRYGIVTERDYRDERRAGA
jgi:hypothetical protein